MVLTKDNVFFITCFSTIKLMHSQASHATHTYNYSRIECRQARAAAAPCARRLPPLKDAVGTAGGRVRPPPAPAHRPSRQPPPLTSQPASGARSESAAGRPPAAISPGVPAVAVELSEPHQIWATLLLEHCRPKRTVLRQ